MYKLEKRKKLKFINLLIIGLVLEIRFQIIRELSYGSEISRYKSYKSLSIND